MRASGACAAVWAMAAALCVCPRAIAADKAQCIASAERAQRLRRAGKLRESREQLATCAESSCPSVVRDDCARWMGEIIELVPSIVVGARDDRGRDLVRVRVSIDGAVVEERLDGRPIELDPGPHDLRFDADGFTPVEQRILVKEREQSRAVAVTFSVPAHDGPAGSSGVPLLAWGLGGLGLAALAGALYFDASAFEEASCKPHCSGPQVDSIKTRTYVAAGLLGVGLLGIGGAAAVFFVSRSAGSSSSTPSGFRLEVGPTVGGGFGRLEVGF